MTSQQQAQAARTRSRTFAEDVASRTPEVAAPLVAAPSWALSRRKRLLDLAMSLVLAPFVLLIVVVAGAISMVVFRTWPLFFQQRRGLHERPFRVLKLRSLPRSFPEQQGKLGLDLEGQGRWSRLIRHSHIDELPQVFNVLGGSMSMVGPRPMIDEVLDFLDPEEREVRALVRPGLTGAWQVSTAGAAPLHDCTALDELYVRRCSLRTDLRILRWTVGVVVNHRTRPPDTVTEALAN